MAEDVNYWAVRPLVLLVSAVRPVSSHLEYKDQACLRAHWEVEQEFLACRRYRTVFNLPQSVAGADRKDVVDKEIIKEIQQDTEAGRKIRAMAEDASFSAVQHLASASVASEDLQDSFRLVSNRPE